MLTITTLIQKLMEENCEKTVTALARYLTAPLNDDTAPDLIPTLAANLSDGATEMDLLDAFALDWEDSGYVPTVAQILLDASEWYSEHPEINALPIDTVVGAMVIGLIIRTDYLLASLRNIDAWERTPVIDAALHECRVWYFG